MSVNEEYNARVMAIGIRIRDRYGDHASAMAAANRLSAIARALSSKS